MTNQDVIELVKAGLSESLIAEKIRTAHATSFDISVNGLKALKQNGVPEEVMHAMMQSSTSSAGYSTSDDPGEVHQPGIYAQISGRDGQTHLIMLEHTQPSATKGGHSTAANFGTAATSIGSLTGMIPISHGKIHVKQEINGARSPVQLDDRNPTFYLYITEDTQRFGGSDFSVRDFTLLKFKQTSRAREIEISINASEFQSGGGMVGLSDKEREPTTAHKVKPGIYMVKLLEPLKPGEYAFEHLLDGVYYDFGITGVQ